MEFSDIVKYADEYGFSGVIIFSILSVLVALFKMEWFIKFITNLISKSRNNKKDNEIVEDELSIVGEKHSARGDTRHVTLFGDFFVDDQDHEDDSKQ